MAYNQRAPERQVKFGAYPLFSASTSDRVFCLASSAGVRIRSLGFPRKSSGAQSRLHSPSARVPLPNGERNRSRRRRWPKATCTVSRKAGSEVKDAAVQRTPARPPAAARTCPQAARISHAGWCAEHKEPPPQIQQDGTHGTLSKRQNPIDHRCAV